jgi:nickel-dependent lactate racemase
MRVSLNYGLSRFEAELPAGRLVAATPDGGPDLADPAAAVRAALEEPFGFPPLRRALTPDDHVTVVVDEHLPSLAGLLAPVLEHVAGAGVSPAALTLLCPAPPAEHPWVAGLPEAFRGARVEVHDAADRRHLSYLATTRGGRRLYLNRSVVDADQLVVLTGRHYDPLLGYGGAEGAIYPAFSDEATRAELGKQVRLDPPGPEPWHARREAEEAAWLLGAPFFVQVIEGAGDELAGVVAGTAEASAEGRRRLDARWRRAVPRRADVVVAGLSGDPARQTFADLAAAAACATRVARPGGRIVLLSQARTGSTAGLDLLRQAEEPAEVLARLQGKHTLELAPVLQWAGAAAHARIALLSGLPDEAAEELFATPLSGPAGAQRLLDAGGSCLFLEDAHKALAVVESG